MEPVRRAFWTSVMLTGWVLGSLRKQGCKAARLVGALALLMTASFGAALPGLPVALIIALTLR